MRSSKDKYYGPTPIDRSEWGNLLYKPYYEKSGAFSNLTSFFANTTGANIFTALWEHLGERFNADNNLGQLADFTVDPKLEYWKMTVTIK
jgi:hypothetical protein